MPVQPTAIKIKLVPITVAMVIPLIGLFEDPINPTILDETVTNNAPKIITKIPINNFCKILSPGTWGKMAIKAMSDKLPIPTIFRLRSLSVLNTTSFVVPEFFIELKLPLTDFIIVGIVFINVIIPPAVTAPAPI